MLGSVVDVRARASLFAVHQVNSRCLNAGLLRRRCLVSVPPDITTVVAVVRRCGRIGPAPLPAHPALLARKGAGRFGRLAARTAVSGEIPGLIVPVQFRVRRRVLCAVVVDRDLNDSQQALVSVSNISPSPGLGAMSL